MIRENGEPTYFASDVAYHLDKLNRGFDRIIDIWGADHHGYMDRIRAALRALHGDDSPLTVLLVQFAVLYRGGEKVSMSTRSGEFVTLRELRDEVGSDAARFFYVLRKCDQHLDFDLELARSSSNDNPVYYVQYAHARIGAVLRQLAERGLKYEQPGAGRARRPGRDTPELELAATLARYPELIESAALAHEPHQIAYYLRELAGLFHAYYNNHPFLVDDAGLRNARLTLVLAVRQVLATACACWAYPPRKPCRVRPWPRPVVPRPFQQEIARHPVADRRAAARRRAHVGCATLLLSRQQTVRRFRQPDLVKQETCGQRREKSRRLSACLNQSSISIPSCRSSKPCCPIPRAARKPPRPSRPKRA